MASHELRTDKAGNTYYLIVARNKNGNKVKTTWHPEPGWSQKYIEHQLRKVEDSFETQVKAGEVLNRKERAEADAAAIAEEKKIETLKQYSERVFMPGIAVRCSEHTRAAYQSILDNHIYKALGDRKLTETTAPEIESFLLTLQAEKSLKFASVCLVYTVLNSIFKQAFKGKSSLNPMLDVDRPKSTKAEIKDEETQYCDEEELLYILECAAAETLRTGSLRWEIFIRLMLDTGCRKGEMCGLKWNCVNFADNTIRIENNLCYTPEKGVYDDTPKGKTVRTIDVDPEIMNLLFKYRAEGNEEGIVNIKSASGYVFSRDGGVTPINPFTPNMYFKSFGKRYQIKDFHPHKLRHSFASIAITNGADIASVSKKLGHADETITLRKYTHSNMEAQRRASDTFRNALKAKKASKDEATKDA